MASWKFYSLKYISKLEISCILLVEEELDIFFSSCMKRAEVYSHVLSYNLTLHGKENFAEKVLSDYQIKECMENILSKVSIEIIKDKGYLDLNNVSPESVEDCYDEFLEETVNNARITQITTSICQYVMDYSISCILSKICMNNVANELLKRYISARKILDRNNFTNQRRKHQEVIYRQMEGLLTNIKLSLKNELVKICITAINRIEDTCSNCNLKIIGG